MTITLVGYEHTPGTGGNLAANLPAGVQDGDLLLAFVVRYSNAAFSNPAGWTELYDDNPGTTYKTQGRVEYRIADSEPASYTWGTDANEGGDVVIMAYRGVSLSSPINVSNYTSKSFTAPNVTTTIDGCVILRWAWSGLAYFGDSPRTVTFAAGATEIWDVSNAIYQGFGSVSNNACASSILAIAGATGTLVITPNYQTYLSGGSYGVATIALNELNLGHIYIYNVQEE